MRVYQQAIEMNRQLASVAPRIERHDRDLQPDKGASPVIGARGGRGNPSAATVLATVMRRT